MPEEKWIHKTQDNHVIITDGMTDLKFFQDGSIEIESPVYRKLGIEIRRVDPSDEANPPGALYRIDTYCPTAGIKQMKDIAWILSDGSFMTRKNRFKNV
jgi:hypothetical protein